MRYYILESGSKGNSTIISAKGKYLVVDNGLSMRKFKNSIANLNIELSDLNAVLVTHSHSDHISGLKVFNYNYLYTTKTTFKAIDDNYIFNQNHELIPYHEYTINGFKITVLPTSHDASGSIGFVIECDDEKLVYITDTGYIYERVLDYIKGATYYIFESNHNVRMQLKTGRPQYLIDRIMGDYGHLSNEDSALYLSESITSNTKEVVLAHLSEEANTPEVALDTFYKIMLKRGVDVSNISVRCALQNEMISGGNIEKELCYD